MFATTLSASTTGGSGSVASSVPTAAPPPPPPHHHHHHHPPTTPNHRGCGGGGGGGMGGPLLPNMLSELNFETKLLLQRRRRSSSQKTKGGTAGTGVGSSSSSKNNNNSKSNMSSSSSNNNSNSTSSRSFFSNFRDGLFCLSYLDGGGDESEHDLFYDAVQDDGNNGRKSMSTSTSTSKAKTTTKTTTKKSSSAKTLSIRGGGGVGDDQNSDPILNVPEWGQEVLHYHPTGAGAGAQHQHQHKQDHNASLSSFQGGSSYYFTPHSSFNSLPKEPSAAPFSSSAGHDHPTLYYPTNPPQQQNGHPHPSKMMTKAALRDGSSSSSSTRLRSSSNHHHDHDQNRMDSSNGSSPFSRIRSPPAPPASKLPDRFLRAGKGDVEEGKRRYQATLEWRRDHNIDGILLEPHPNFELIKKHYPHYYHCRGHNNEPVFFEQPPKTDLQALKAAGIDLDGLVRHYTMVTEFQWQFIETNDHARSITVLDLEGIRMMDFVGECVEYVRKCSHFTGQHYPERAGFVIVINIPRWFNMIWNVVKPMVDEVTLRKISIVRGKKEVFQALADKIPVENIPKQYGGMSPYELGDSPEERDLRALMEHNNALANGDFSCGGHTTKNPPCKFCSWGPVRSY